MSLKKSNTQSKSCSLTLALNIVMQQYLWNVLKDGDVITVFDVFPDNGYVVISVIFWLFMI